MFCWGIYELYLGRWDLTLNGDGRVKEAKGQLIQIDDQIFGLPAIDDWEKTLIEDVEEKTLKASPP